MNARRTLKAAFAALLAALMALAVFPVSALPAQEVEKSPVAPYWTVPDGYNAHDYNKMAALLEQEDGFGIKNGQKLNPDYDVNDPETWKLEGYDGEEVSEFFDGSLHFIDDPVLGVEWEYCSDDGAYHVCSFIVPAIGYIYEDGSVNPYLDETEQWDFVGDIDFGEMECLYAFAMRDHYGDEARNIDLSNCESLTFLICTNCSVDNLNLSGSDGLYWVILSGTESQLDLTTVGAADGCAAYLELWDLGETPVIFPQTSLDELLIFDCRYETLDLSGMTGMQLFVFENSPDWDHDYLGVTEIKYCGRTVAVEGGHGYIRSIYLDYESGWFDDATVQVEDDYLWEIAGWYDENGNRLTNVESYYWENDTYCFEPEETGTFIARISAIGGDPIVGDTDGDGEVSATDALLLMRFCIGELTADQIDIETADVNGDGAIDLLDALLTLRIALGEV